MNGNARDSDGRPYYSPFRCRQTALWRPGVRPRYYRPADDVRQAAWDVLTEAVESGLAVRGGYFFLGEFPSTVQWLETAADVKLLCDVLLKKSPSPQHLTYVDIGDSNLSDEGFAELGPLFAGPIKCFSAENTFVQDASIRLFCDTLVQKKGLAHVQQVSFYGCDLTEASFVSFSAALSCTHCRIHTLILPQLPSLPQIWTTALATNARVLSLQPVPESLPNLLERNFAADKACIRATAYLLWLAKQADSPCCIGDRNLWRVIARFLHTTRGDPEWLMMPSPQIEESHHPLVRAILSSDPKKIARLFQADLICHVGVFVVTDKGRILLQKCSPSGDLYQSFGGCNYPRNVLRMMNSLRLELMDEASLLYSQEQGFLRSSPLILSGSTLLQVLLYDDEVLSCVPLWSPEKARKYFSSKVVPHGCTERSLIPDPVYQAGAYVFLFDLQKALGKMWRSCDRTAFDSVFHIVEQLCEGSPHLSDAMIVLPPLPGDRTGGYGRLTDIASNFNACPLLRQASTSCWNPILWKRASELFEDDSLLEQLLKVTK